MKFLKNNLKVIIAFVVGMILTGGVVYAEISASEITYTTVKNAEIQNVTQALNDLYSKISNANSIVSIESKDKVSSIECNVGDYFLIQTIYGANGDIGGLTGCQVIAKCSGPASSNVDSHGVFVCATSTTISASHQFGYIKLGIQ